MEPEIIEDDSDAINMQYMPSIATNGSPSVGQEASLSFKQNFASRRLTKVDILPDLFLSSLLVIILNIIVRTLSSLHIQTTYITLYNDMIRVHAMTIIPSTLLANSSLCFYSSRYLSGRMPVGEFIPLPQLKVKPLLFFNSFSARVALIGGVVQVHLSFLNQAGSRRRKSRKLALNRFSDFRLRTHRLTHISVEQKDDKYATYGSLA